MWYNSSTNSWKPWKCTRCSLIFTLRDIYINFNLDPLTWSSRSTKFKDIFPWSIKKNKLYGPFLWMGFNCLKATATSSGQFTFYHSVPRNSWYSFYQPRKDERLSRPWSHPVVLNMGLLDWESSALSLKWLQKPSKSVQE